LLCGFNPAGEYHLAGVLEHADPMEGLADVEAYPKGHLALSALLYRATSPYLVLALHGIPLARASPYKAIPFSQIPISGLLRDP